MKTCFKLIALGLLAGLAEAGHLPLSFEARDGAFITHGLRQPLALTPTGITFLELVGANRSAEGTGLNRLAGVANYYLGNDPAQWRVGVPLYERVEFRGVYPGVDVVYYGTDQHLEHDFIVAPGADPNQIRLRAGKFALTPDGELTTGEFRLRRPVIFQGNRQIAGGYCLDTDGTAGFVVGEYDPSRELVIDPVLVFSTYLGGTGTEIGQSIAVHTNGQVYVTGYTESANFPSATGSLGGTRDAYVAKLNAAGTALLFATYIGGTGIEQGHGLAVDKDGNAYIGGVTQSADFPTTVGAFDTTYGGPSDAFVVKLSATGALVYSTYLGGSGDENNVFALGGVAVNTAGNAFVAGITTSADFPTTSGAHKQFLSGPSDAFVVKLDATGTGLVYGTYLGGSSYDGAYGVAIDATEAAYVAGLTRSSNFPTTAGAFDRTFGGGLCFNNSVPCADGFVAKLNPAGSALVYSTYLGGAREDNSYAIAADIKGNAYVTGDTTSTNFPVSPGAFSSVNTGLGDAFVTKLNSNGTAAVFSTYLGGSSGLDGGYAIAVDAHQSAYVAGEGRAFTFPVTPDAVNTNSPGGFVAKLNVGGTDLEYSTFLGDGAYGIALDSAANIYVTGYTDATNFPTTGGAISTTRSGFRDSFVTKLSNIPSPPQADLHLTKTGPAGDAPISAPIAYTLLVTNLGPDQATTVVLTDTLPATTAFLSAVPSQGTCQLQGNLLTCQLGTLTAAATVTLQLSASTDGRLTNTASVTATQPDPDPSNNSAVVITQVVRPIHDLAITAFKAPKKVTLKAGVLPKPDKMKLTVRNAGPNTETITTLAMLTNLVKITIESLGGCPVPGPVLTPPKLLPVVLSPGKSLKLSYTVTLDCANDAAAGLGHEDYRFTAQVNHAVIDGNPDTTPTNDTCPRPASGTDKGCAKGLELLTDVIGP
ncbi:MAG: hypothetical protein PCFJNLEI_03192 [Verrucomicrobiae bacterium]|nr:hypothetical protein [Verrucomicrobiae bacterium]